MRRRSLIAVAVTFTVSLVVGASGAQAVLVNMGAAGKTGVALVPGTSPNVVSTAACSDPWLASDFSPLPSYGLCYGGGPVMHSNETFALTWDPRRMYWQTTRDYVEQFLRDVADGSGSFTSPYAVTSQYKDGPSDTNRAANASIYGGGCIDYGQPGGATCNFINGTGTGTGTPYPTGGCDPTKVTGTSYDMPAVTNTDCLTDSQIQSYLNTTITQMGLTNHVKPGYSPEIVLLTPPGVEVCLDNAGTWCSANTDSSDPKSPNFKSPGRSQFCSYHSHVLVGSTDFVYVVQPWTAYTNCDEPKLPALDSTATAQQFAIDVGIRLVNPLSQGQIAAIVNPFLNGWSGSQSGSQYPREINDNGCGPDGYPYDKVTVGASSQNPYYLQPEFSNAGVIESDPNAPACATGVALAPTFVVPSAVNRGDIVQFDGSTTVSSLIVPKANYVWSFGDGASAVGPSVVHAYTTGGTYSVTLSVKDRGGDNARLSQTIVVLGPNGQPVSPPAQPSPGLHVRMQIMPQSMRAMLRSGVVLALSCDQAADGIATLSISRGAARRAHISSAQGSSVVIGRGTVSGIKSGTMKLHLGLSRATAAKLKRLGHVTLTVRLTLVGADGSRAAIIAAGRY
jgi:hypothetical protein